MSEQQLSTEQKNLELKIIIEVSAKAENLYNKVVPLGDHAAYALKKFHRSQMTGLENIAEGTLKAVDVLDYIKRQTARYKYWREPFPPQSTVPFGQRLLSFFEQELLMHSDLISKRLELADATDEQKQLHRRIYLLLIRQCIHHLVIQYEFRVNIPDDLKQRGA